MASKRPVEGESEACVEWTTPGIFIIALEQNLVVIYEALKEAAEVNDQLDVDAFQGFMLSVEFELCKRLVHIELK